MYSPLSNSSVFPVHPQCALVDSDEGCECVSDRLWMCVYIHLFAQRYPACVRPTGVERLSIVEVNKNPSLTKREQTAAVCSGFPNKHSTRRATDGGERKRHWERQAFRTRLVLCNSRWNGDVLLITLCSRGGLLQWLDADPNLHIKAQTYSD